MESSRNRLPGKGDARAAYAGRACDPVRDQAGDRLSAAIRILPPLHRPPYFSCTTADRAKQRRPKRMTYPGTHIAAALLLLSIRTAR